MTSTPEFTGARTHTVLCPATYDEPRKARSAELDETHTCDLTERHDGPHHCESCGKYWLVRLGVAKQGVAARAQVHTARQDATTTGTGFVMITRAEDGTFTYERIEPHRVMVKAKSTG
jgi:hypothetical protein